MSPAVKNGLLLVALVAILGAAAMFFSRGDKDRTYPEDGPKTEWMCDKCEKHFELSPAVYKDWIDSTDKVRREAGMGNQVVFWCPDCEAFHVVRAKVHSASGKWYLSTNSEGIRLPPPEWLEEWMQKEQGG